MMRILQVFVAVLTIVASTLTMGALLAHSSASTLSSLAQSVDETPDATPTATPTESPSAVPVAEDDNMGNKVGKVWIYEDTNFMTYPLDNDSDPLGRDLEICSYSYKSKKHVANDKGKPPTKLWVGARTKKPVTVDVWYKTAPVDTGCDPEQTAKGTITFTVNKVKEIKAKFYGKSKLVIRNPNKAGKLELWINRDSSKGWHPKTYTLKARKSLTLKGNYSKGGYIGEFFYRNYQTRLKGGSFK